MTKEQEQFGKQLLLFWTWCVCNIHNFHCKHTYLCLLLLQRNNYFLKKCKIIWNLQKVYVPLHRWNKNAGLVVNEILWIKLGLTAEHYIKNFQQVPASRVGFFFYGCSAFFLFSTKRHRVKTVQSRWG